MGAVLSGCGTDQPEASVTVGAIAIASNSPVLDQPIIDPGDGGDYQPNIDPAEFVDGVDNPYFPLLPGTRWVYEGVVDGQRERIELEVTTEIKVILGITAVGVSDTNYIDGELEALTTDWYAQDRAGNVWYLAEFTQNYQNGQPTDTEAWEAGIDGALPGIFMLAEPAVGDAYRQLYQAGYAEDLAEVVRLGATRSIGLGEYGDVIVILGWTALEPEIIEEKYYAAGVGKISEALTAGGTGGTELVEFMPGG